MMFMVNIIPTTAVLVYFMVLPNGLNEHCIDVGMTALILPYA
jgi:hypothetical protein